MDDPQVINSGRRINDGMSAFIAKRLVQMLISKGKSPQKRRYWSWDHFKENVSDIRNSKVADLIEELMGFSINVDIVDAHASPNEVAHEYGLTLLETFGGV
ncbi:MAG: UDP binding domain-containing protein [Spirosomataceae bacterium]